jgi:hypothetical protein
MEVTSSTVTLYEALLVSRPQKRGDGGGGGGEREREREWGKCVGV